MPARALLVLLVMLNFGVATWWLLRPGPSSPASWVQPDGVPRLQLLGEAAGAGGSAPAAGQAQAGAVPDAAADPGAGDAAPTVGADPSAAQGEMAEPEAAATNAAAPAADTAAPASTAAAPAPTTPASPAVRCLSFGPFSDASSVATARSTLQPLGAARTRVRDVVDAPRGWRVVMAPQADRAAADTLAAKIREAGFNDLLVVPSGDEANGIALGRYGSEPAARRRETALRDAGFPAQAQPLGDATVRHWLDVAAGPTFDAANARTAVAAAQAQDIDCAGIVDAPPPR